MSQPVPLSGLAAWMMRLSQRGDVALLVLIVAILCLLVLPVPPAVLDSLIALNLAVSIGLLMLSIYVNTPLGLSTFPTLLLFTTLLRLSLNIASTKQILLTGNAGHIIDTFGHLVVGGSVIVGIVVFVIIAIVQFIVVAKGSERIAEVGARFTLDGMPGKQMSIDADLRVGAISKEEAKRRRARLEEESQFFGAMDGAMKFVKGDAIAAMIIALVNILAGIAVGMLVRDMGFAAASQRYTVLTVGDGMVSQIPSLFVSIAAGLLVTRVVNGESRASNLGVQIARQVLDQPAALLVTAAVLVGFLLIPGFPKLQFGALALFLGLIGWVLIRVPMRRRSFENVPMPSLRRDGTVDAPVFIQQTADNALVPLSLRVGPNFSRHVDAAAFDAALALVRTRIKREFGIPYPGLEVRYDDALLEDAYEVDVHELPKARGRLPSAWFAEGLAAGDEGTWVEANAPFGSGVWMPVRGDDQDGAVSWHRVEQVLARHIEWVLLKQPEVLLGFQETHQLLEELAKSAPELAIELQKNVPLPRITDVLRRLVQERVSIRPFREICESLIVWAPREKDAVTLTENVRVDLGRYIAHRHASAGGGIAALVVAPLTEQWIRQAIQQSPAGGYVSLAPEDIAALLDAIESLLSSMAQPQESLVLVTSMDIRRYIRRMLESRFPALSVLSYQELGSHAALRSMGIVTIQRHVTAG